MNNWDDLRFFLELARNGSLTAAANVLNVRHTTIARRVQSLESQLNVRLFGHINNQYVLSQAGENIFEQALAIEEQTLSIQRKVFGQDAELSGTLRLTAAHDLANRLLLHKLNEFTDDYPKIDLDLLTTTGLVGLSAREADIALRLTAKPPEYLVGREIMKLRHGIYASNNTIATLKKSTSVILFRSELSNPPWVCEHFPNAKTILRVDDVSSMVVAVKSHLGIAKMPCYVGDSEPSLWRLRLNLKPSDWGIWLLSHIDLRSSARVRVCREFLEKIIELQRPLIQGENSNYFHD